MFSRTGKTVSDFEDLSADLAFDAKKARKYADLSAEFAEHQRELQKLKTRMDHLQKDSRGGGFPWTLLLLAGGAVALYLSNETVRAQVGDLLSRVTPDNNEEQGSPQPSMGTSSPTVTAGMTPGQSGNEAYGTGGTGTPAAGSPTGGTGSSPGNQGTNTTSMNKNNKTPS